MSSQQQQTRNPAALAQEYQSRRNELQNLATKIGEVEADAEEHKLVLSTLRPIVEKEPERKAFRLMGGVLVEKSVKETKAAVEEGEAGLGQLLQQLIEQYKAKEAQLAEFTQKYAPPTGQAGGAGQGQGGARPVAGSGAAGQ